jgi:hypothetical protein
MGSEWKRQSFAVILKMPDLKNRVKLDLRISKRDLLFLARLIDVEVDLKIKREEGELLGLLSDESRTELKGIRDELLKRAELEEFYGELVKMT